MAKDRWNLQCDIDMGYRKKALDQQDAILDILKEETDLAKSIEEEMENDLDIRLESTIALLSNELKEDSRRVSISEAREKKDQTLRKIFVECIKSTLPIAENILDAREDYVNGFLEESYDKMYDQGLLNEYAKEGAWDKLVESATKHSWDSNKSVEDCFVEVVNECAIVIDGIITRVEDKIKNAVQLESITTIFKEDKDFMKNSKTLFRRLTEHNYKICAKEELPIDVSLSEEAVIRASVDYALLEMVNTARIMDTFNYDSVNESYGFLR